MPETGAFLAEVFASWGAEAGTAAAVGEGTGAAITAGEAGSVALGGGAELSGGLALEGAAGAGTAAGFGGVTDLGVGLGTGAGVGGAGAVAMGGADATTLAAGTPVYGADAGGASGDALATGQGGPGTSLSTTPAPGQPVTGTTTPSTWDQISSFFGGSNGGSNLTSLFGKGGSGLGLIQAVSGIYGLSEASRLKKMQMQPNVAGEQAVQRSMAAQGYQGSGNMVAALNQYGINGSQRAASGAESPLMGQLSSLGLITSALPSLAGWGKATAPAPAVADQG